MQTINIRFQTIVRKLDFSGGICFQYFGINISQAEVVNEAANEKFNAINM